jgi:hypothetical protein
MSGKLMGTLFGRQLTDSQMMVALALADHSDDDGANIYPSIELIAWKVGKSERQVQRVIRDLEAIGLLEKVAEARQHRPAEYRMNVWAAPSKPEPEDSQGRHTDVTPGPGDHSPQGRHPDVTPGPCPEGLTGDAQMSPLAEGPEAPRGDISSTPWVTPRCHPNRHKEPPEPSKTASEIANEFAADDDGDELDDDPDWYSDADIERWQAMLDGEAA